MKHIDSIKNAINRVVHVITQIVPLCPQSPRCLEGCPRGQRSSVSDLQAVVHYSAALVQRRVGIIIMRLKSVSLWTLMPKRCCLFGDLSDFREPHYYLGTSLTASVLFLTHLMLSNLNYTAVIHRGKWHICNCDHLDMYVCMILKSLLPRLWSAVVAATFVTYIALIPISRIALASKLLLLTAWLVQMSESRTVATELAEAVTIFLDHFWCVF